MGDEWSNQRLADVVELIGGGTPKRNHSDYWGGDIPWLSVRDFNNDNRYVYSTEETITEEGVKNSSTKILSPGQIIISARGTVGALAQLVRPMAFNQSCYGINAKDGTFNDYLFYLLKHTVANLQRITHGAVFDTITRETFQHVEIALPSLPEQRAIAHILGSLDDKIELNRQMAQTLESIARAIFKSWFVDFDPVKAKMEGKQPEGMSEEVSALFPDKFVESKLGMIPEGWASGKFSDISENIRINIRKDAINPNDCYIGLEHIPRKSLFLNNWGIGADVTSNKHRFLRYDLLFGKLRPYFHKIIIAPFNGICSTDILVIRSLEPHWYSLMTLGLSQESVVDNVTNQSEGTRMPRTNWNQVGSQPIVIPSKKVAIAFDALILPMLQRVVEMAHENRHLSELRDTQLPRLISGKIRVNQPEDAAA